MVTKLQLYKNNNFAPKILFAYCVLKIELRRKSSLVKFSGGHWPEFEYPSPNLEWTFNCSI